MDANAIRTSFREYAQLIEDLWVEADCFRTLLIHYTHLTSEQLDETLAEAKRDPRVKKRMEEKFGHLRKALDSLGVQAALEAQQSSPPPKSKEN